jgi:hypothetical protein
MTTFTADDLRELARRREHPTVSLLMPVHPSSPDELRGDPIRFQQLVEQARANLVALGHRPTDADTLLQPATRLLGDLSFWRQPGEGLAVYVGEGWSRVFRVPTALPEVVTCNDEPHLLPLMGLVQHDGRFFVLAVTANEFRFLECTRFTLKRIPLDNVPQNLEDAASVWEQGPITRHAHASSVPNVSRRSSGGPILYSQGFGQTERKTNELRDWFQGLDAAMRPHLVNRNVPLVFAGLERNARLFAAVCTHPFLTNSPVRGDFKGKSDEQLRDEAWAIVQPLYDGEIRHHLQRFHNRRRDMETSSDLSEVLTAAAEGRVDTLFVAEGASSFGKFDPDEGSLEMHADEQPGDVDLVNEAATLAFINGANVFSLPKDQLPESDAEVSALMRW